VKGKYKEDLDETDSGSQKRHLSSESLSAPSMADCPPQPVVTNTG